MEIVSINEARRFSSQAIQKNELMARGDLSVQLWCFEAGQRDEEQLAGERIYQVLEGEVLVRLGDERQRLGKGKLLRIPANTAHVLENAGGGLLVVMALSAA